MKLFRKWVNYTIMHPFKAWIIRCVIFSLFYGLATGNYNFTNGIGFATFFWICSLPGIREYKAEKERKAELDYLAHQIAVENARIRNKTE